jgi:hypothetical protein
LRALICSSQAPITLGDNVTLNLVKGGVITGRVLNSVGEPVIAVNMSVIRVRDTEGKSVQGVPWRRAHCPNR